MFGSLPTFTHGQYMSASLHLNAVVRYLRALHDVYIGAQVPFQGVMGFYTAIDDPGYKGALRHTWNLLDYSFEHYGSAATEIFIDGVAVPGTSQSGTGTFSGTGIDISGLGLAAGNLYEITVPGARDNVRINYIRERASQSYPTLADFSGTAVRSAAEWQDLADYAETLAAAIGAPVPVGTRREVRDGTLAAGSFLYTTPLVSYHVYAKTPQNRSNYPDPGGDRYGEVILEIDGQIAAVWRVGDSAGTVTGAYRFEETAAGGNWGRDFLGTWDLRDYSNTSGLTVGQVYPYRLYYSQSTTWDTVHKGRLYKLYFAPLDGYDLSGWASLSEWAHGDVIYGASSPTVQDVADDLALLQSLAAAHNYPAPECRGDMLYGVRRRRWLHYKSAEGGQLIYELRGENKSVGLPATNGSEWLAVDLDSIENLWQGREYFLSGLQYALEDTTI